MYVMGLKQEQLVQQQLQILNLGTMVTLVVNQTHVVLHLDQLLVVEVVLHLLQALNLGTMEILVVKLMFVEILTLVQLLVVEVAQLQLLHYLEIKVTLVLQVLIVVV